MMQRTDDRAPFRASPIRREVLHLPQAGQMDTSRWGSHVRSLSRDGDKVTGASLLTAEQVAERWCIPKAHVYRLARTGRVECVQLGRYTRFRLEVLEQFERSGGTRNGGVPDDQRLIFAAPWRNAVEDALKERRS